MSEEVRGQRSEHHHAGDALDASDEQLSNAVVALEVGVGQLEEARGSVEESNA